MVAMCAITSPPNTLREILHQQLAAQDAAGAFCCPRLLSLFSYICTSLFLSNISQEIFHQQLPKMPKEYIVRLVFDRNHHSIVLTKKGVPIGGITYRPFVEQKFGEIAFCAVASNCQVCLRLLA